MCRQFDSGPRHRMTKMTIRLSPIRVGAGLSTRKSGLAATQDALDAALGPLEGAIPDLAFLFVAPQFEDELESVLVMLADPYTFPAHLLLDHLNEHAPGLPVVGGMASGGIVAGRTRLIADDEILTEGAVGAILEGAEGATAVVSQGCRPVGETFAITRAERNVVFELGGQPAVTRIEELYATATERDQLLMRRGLHVGQATNELKAELGRGDFVIRNLVGIDRDKGAIAISDMAEVGQTIQFQVRDAESAREDLRATLDTQRDSPVAGALLFSCNGRGMGLFGQPDHDINAMRGAFGDIPVAGFFAAGELGPVGGRNFVHGFTASILLFRNSSKPKL